jgi:acetylornithine deacetylase/succinyl-diaminopimelate desuccinylase-like protein
VLGAWFPVRGSVLGCRFLVRRPAAGLALALAGSAALLAQAPAQPDWKALEAETLAHFQSLVRIETMDPPGREELAADYVVQVLKKEGIPTQTFVLEAGRTNVVARLKGSGRRRPLLLMGHLDTVNVDPTKWTFPPFSAARDGGYIYGRGTVDDKDNVTASLMTMLMLKRLNVPLDRDVIFLAEAGEEGSTRIGIQFMVDQHFAEIDAEYCIAEGGGVTRIDGRAKYASVQTLEKIPRQIQLTARGVAGHGSVPLKTNAILNLAGAVSAVGLWQPPVRLNETTGAYFKRLADISSPEEAKRYLAALSLDPKVTAEVANWFFEHEPRHASMLRTSLSPNIFTAGYRVNVIPSEATATIDVRLLPDEDPDKFLETVRGIVNNPAIDVSFAARSRPRTPETRLDSPALAAIEAAVKRHYGTVTLPTMSTGATDMAYLRQKGMQCYGVGPATDLEDGPKGFGAHSDQERILEAELYRFVQFYWDATVSIAGRN